EWYNREDPPDRLQPCPIGEGTLQKLNATPHRLSLAKTRGSAWGMMVACLGLAGCNDSSPVIYDDFVTSRALVHGQVGSSTPLAAGARVSVVVYPAQCGVGLAFQGEAPLDASGTYRIL